MPRYFFDICLDEKRIPDEEGMECGGLNDALNEVRRSARDLAAAVLHEAAELEKACVEIRAADGTVVAAMAVHEVFRHPLSPQFRDRCEDCDRPDSDR